MSIKQIIKEYNIQLFPGGRIGLPKGKKVTPAVVKLIRSKKDEIIAELEAQATAEVAAQKAAAEEARIARENERAAIRSGNTKITVTFVDGEHLSGYRVHGVAADLLVEAGLARHVYGWGYLVNDSVIDALGTEFTFADALATIENADEGTDTTREDALAEASRAGEAVVIRRWTEPCSDPHEECSLDAVVEYALPDGTTKVERRHTW